MRAITLALTGTFVLAGCKSQPQDPLGKVLEIGVQAEKDIEANRAEQAATTDVAKSVEFGKKEHAIIDKAMTDIEAVLGGKGARQPVALGTSTDTLPVNFARASVGIPDFHKGIFRINLQIAGTGKRPLPEGAFFQLVALDAQGKILSSKDASVVDSLKRNDTLYAGGMFRGSEILGASSVAAR
ncbi:MAG TPA: hypothetical protein PKY05_05995 [Fibrobacteria bacterium]|nr:hypothetical protein [Fibrobacteria bacterium]